MSMLKNALEAALSDLVIEYGLLTCRAFSDTFSRLENTEPSVSSEPPSPIEKGLPAIFGGCFGKYDARSFSVDQNSSGNSHHLRKRHSSAAVNNPTAAANRLFNLDSLNVTVCI